MQPKFVLPLVILSVLTAIGFSSRWVYEQNRVYQLTIAAGSRDGEYYKFAQALETVVERHYPQVRISLQETAGAQENLDLVDQNQAQLGIVQSNTPTKPSTRAVALLFPEVFHLLARPNTGIQTVGDLRGKRIALMPQGSGSYDLFWLLAQHYGLNATALTPLPMPAEQAYAALQQGQVDALFRVMALGNSKMKQLLQRSQAQIIAIDQVDSLRLNLPYLKAATIPKGTYDGAIPLPGKDVSVVGVEAVLISRDTVRADVIHEITRTLFEFRSELVTLDPKAAVMTLPNASENLGLPLHAGAKAYYDRERPIFLVQYAEPIGLLISVGVLCISGLWQFRMWLEGRQKNRADMYNQEILDLIKQVETSHDIKELEGIRNQLFEILRKVVIDLDKDRISPESFQSFTFPWEVAVTTLRHREMMLLNSRS